MVQLLLNGAPVEVDGEDDRPLLWVLRESLGLTGAKYGCGAGLCGACTVHLDGQAVRSCLIPMKSAVGRTITTIEGVAADPDHPVLSAWRAEDVPQCGYCQPGQIMSAIALLETHPQPTDAQISSAMAGTLCRCGTYLRIRRAIHRAARGSPK
jgi:aerobic-type carbon monoxide dehydrogenase small subunit (CoxS/CutS family)